MTDPIVTKDCILRDLPMEVYHQQICDGPSVSSSNLRDVELKSPAHMFARWSGNPNAAPQTSPALAFGSAAHALILGDEAFELRHVVSPFDSFRSKDAREWRDKQIAAGKVVITEDDLAHIQGMAETLAAHPIAKDGVFDGEVEQSVFWKDEATGLWCKSRMDSRPIGDTLVDLKTTADANPFACRKSVQNYAYDMQFALGAEGLWKVAHQRIAAHLIIFQEKTPPYAVTPVEISAQAIWRAAQRIERARAIVADCLKRGEWPAYQMPEPYYPPEWLEAQLQRDEDSKLLPPPPAWLEELKEPA